MARTHISRESGALSLNKLKVIPQKVATEPIGLWYDLENQAWLDFLKKDGVLKFYDKHLYSYTLRLKKGAKVLRLKSEEDVQRLARKLAKRDKDDKDLYYFNWPKLATQCDGIEFAFDLNIDRFRKKYGFEWTEKTPEGFLIWLLMIPSGCIWNPRAIRSFERLPGNEWIDSPSY